ncbi:MAG TPA: nuclear transport factor 2 family protein [Chitinophagaceae bacterium]|nr:nuclear transport factor 2 family protein [Chitinophagaceae bacterium]
MKNLLTILILLPAICGCGPSQGEKQALENTSLLERTVFGTKDSLILEELFAKDATYIHSSGKVESRAEAIKNIVQNKSIYTKIDTVFGFQSETVNDSVVVRHPFVAKEKKADGSESMLRLNLELVWIKEKGKWKLYRRKASRIQ